MKDIWSLEEHTNFEDLRSNLSDSQVNDVEKLSKEITDFAKNFDYTEVYDMGLVCVLPDYIERTYIWSLLVANAVAASTKEPEVVVLGTGSGLDSVITNLINPRAKIISYELPEDKSSIAFAQKMFKNYNINVDFRLEDFLKADMSDLNPDVVLSENISEYFKGEPQFEVAGRILPYTHEGTFFVPLGFELKLYIDGIYEFNFGHALLNEPQPEIIELGTIIPNMAIRKRREAVVFSNPLNHEGKPILKDASWDIPFMPCLHPHIYIPDIEQVIDFTSYSTAKLSLNTNPEKYNEGSRRKILSGIGHIQATNVMRQIYPNEMYKP